MSDRVGKALAVCCFGTALLLLFLSVLQLSERIERLEAQTPEAIARRNHELRMRQNGDELYPTEHSR